jgi:DNA-binding GntR family transcriptional regulator
MVVGTPAYEQIRDILREEIISGKIPRDTRLVMANLANRFGVSQNPVREALQWLQGEDLVKMSPHKGARVRSLDTLYIRNVYEIRGVIEGLLARESVQYISDETIETLVKINARYLEELSKNNRMKVRSVNKEFHKTIYVCSRNTEALNVYERYEGLLGSLRRKYGFQSERLKVCVVEHEAFIDTLRAKDKRRIELLIRVHIERALDELLALMA